MRKLSLRHKKEKYSHVFEYSTSPEIFHSTAKVIVRVDKDSHRAFAEAPSCGKILEAGLMRRSTM